MRSTLGWGVRCVCLGTADSGHTGVCWAQWMCWGGVTIGCTGVRAHPPHEGSQRRAGVRSVRGCSGLGPAAGGLSCFPADHTAPGPEGGEPTPPSLPLPEPCDQGRPLWSGWGPPACEGPEGDGSATAPPLGPPPGLVQTAAAGTSGLVHMLWVKQALGSNEYFKHFSKMMGSPAPGRAVS